MRASFFKIGHRYQAALQDASDIYHWGCDHGHRTSEEAQRCAEQELARREGKAMNEQHTHEMSPPLCHVSFKRSSSKDGQVGYDIDIYAGCSAEEADVVFGLALRLKEQADEALRPKDRLEQQLEESIK